MLSSPTFHPRRREEHYENSSIFNCIREADIQSWEQWASMWLRIQKVMEILVKRESIEGSCACLAEQENGIGTGRIGKQSVTGITTPTSKTETEWGGIVSNIQPISTIVIQIKLYQLWMDWKKCGLGYCWGIAKPSFDTFEMLLLLTRIERGEIISDVNLSSVL